MLIKNSKGGIEIIALLIIIVASFAFVGGFSPLAKSPLLDNSLFQIQDSPGTDSKNSLQLKTLKFSKKCSEQIGVDLLLDRSASMGWLTPTNIPKIARLKEAVLALTGRLDDMSVIGIQSFTGLTRENNVPISYYSEAKADITEKVNNLTVDGNTPTHDALAFSLDKLREAILIFPERQFNFIFISDGQPNPGEQDPRNPSWPTNPATVIKSLGVNVYTLGIFTSGQESDPRFAELLKSIASKPENYFAADTADDTERLLEQISEKICDQAN